MSKLDPKYYAPPFKLTIKIEKQKGFDAYVSCRSVWLVCLLFAVFDFFFFLKKKRKKGKKWIPCVASIKTCYLFIYSKPLDKVRREGAFLLLFLFKKKKKKKKKLRRSRRSSCG
jgi:hypothetical protein